MRTNPVPGITGVVLLGAVAVASLAACQGADRDQTADPVSESATESPPSARLVEVTAVDYAFQAPAEIAPGWTTFRMRNEGQEEHFLLLSRLPDGKTFEDYRREVVAPFDSVWHSLKSRSIDKAEAGRRLGSLLPEWYLSSVKQMGGPGLVAPGGISQASARLDPGTYVMECYVKTPDGEFHASLGMARPMTVTDVPSGAPAPEADLEMTLSNYDIAIEDEITPGEHTVAVHFEEHPEVGLGNDVHLVRLEDDTDVDELVQWMGWMNLDGLRS
ncbi:MAG: hypothetical protein ACREK5_05330, partial [Gemmatimonadota bacterium]